MAKALCLSHLGIKKNESCYKKSTGCYYILWPFSRTQILHRRLRIDGKAYLRGRPALPPLSGINLMGIKRS